MTKTKLKPADQWRHDLENQPGPHRHPDRFIADELAKLGAAQNLSDTDLARVVALHDALAVAATNVASLEAAASDPRGEQHADARAALAAYLAPLHEVTTDTVEIPHLDDCADREAVEIADRDATTRFGLCRVRVVRCISCGAQAVANRHIQTPADPDALERSRKREASFHGTASRAAGKPTRTSKFA